MKKCRVCKILKDEAEFHKTANSDWLCKLCRKQHDQEHYRKNKERLAAHALEYYHTHPEQAIKQAQYKQTPRGKAVTAKFNAIRRSRSLRSEGADNIDIEALYVRDEGECKICNEPCARNDASIDHKTPISKEGLHTWDNVQLAHLKCNVAKGNRI